MSDVVIIFLLIGLAHWAQHLIRCRSCKVVLGALTDLVLEGVVKTLGWPLYVLAYLQDILKPKPASDFEIVEMRKGKDESMDDFMKRVIEEGTKAVKRRGAKSHPDSPCEKAGCLICERAEP